MLSFFIIIIVDIIVEPRSNLNRPIQARDQHFLMGWLVFEICETLTFDLKEG